MNNKKKSLLFLRWARIVFFSCHKRRKKSFVWWIIRILKLNRKKKKSKSDNYDEKNVCVCFLGIVEDSNGEKIVLEMENKNVIIKLVLKDEKRKKNM